MKKKKNTVVVVVSFEQHEFILKMSLLVVEGFGNSQNEQHWAALRKRQRNITAVMESHERSIRSSREASLPKHEDG